MGRQRWPRPRYRRIIAAATGPVVTLVAVLGATGVLPTGGATPAYAVGGAKSNVPSQPSGAIRLEGSVAVPPLDPQARTVSSELPAASGHGKRVVFDIASQRVWLVSADDAVRRTYLVSGSVTDNLNAGTYAVYSTSRRAVGVDESGVMGYMVRFTSGGHAAIGFHDIPTLRGQKLQTKEELGSPRSHGCIRQWRPDAKALWTFAPVGTKVVVL